MLFLSEDTDIFVKAWCVGGLKDLTGSFNSGLWFVAALLVIGAGIIWAIPMQSSRPRATP